MMPPMHRNPPPTSQTSLLGDLSTALPKKGPR